MTALQSFETPREVQVADVERELGRLWSLALAPQAEGGAAVVRACALNLVVILWEAEEAQVEAVTNAIARVSPSHPSRAIVIRCRPGEPDQVAAWVSLQCPMAGASRLCHEEIRIHLSGPSVEHVDNIVFSLLIPDLPSFLWWSGPLPDTPVEERCFGNLAEKCERLILDTLHLQNPVAELVALVHLATQNKAAPGDLNWHRLTPWRQLAAQAFDPPEMRALVRRISGVEVDFQAPGEGIPLQVLLYLSWLGSRLGWRPTSVEEGGADTLVVKFLHQDDEVVALVRRASRQACDDNLVRLGLQAGPCRVGIARKGQELECLLERDGVTTLLHVIPFRPADLASVLDKELAILGRNVIYEEALQMAEVLFMQTLRYLPV